MGKKRNNPARKNEETADDLEAQYRLLFDSNPHPMWVYDFETLRFLAVNDTAIHHFGYSREQLLSMTIKEICPPEDIPRLLDTISKIPQGLFISGPWRIQKKDGTKIDVEITSHSLTFGGRQARFVLANDITERKRADEKLKESYNLLHEVVEEVIDAIFVKDLHGRYLLINSPGARLIGKTREEVIGRDDTELFATETARQIMEDDRRIIDSGETRTYEEVLLAKDGLRRTYLTTKGAYRNREGKVIGVIGIAHDITERRRAEEALKGSEQKQRLVLDHMDEIVYMVSTTKNNPFEGTVQFVSSRVKGLMGYDPDEFLADPNLWFRVVHPDDVPALMESTRNIFSFRKADTRLYRLKHKETEEYRWMEDRVVPQLDGAGTVIGIFGVARDITERKQADEMIQHLAYFDILTGLPNRTLLHDRLQQAIFSSKSEKRPLSLLVMDLDRFKEVNNTLGHPIGDTILRQIGERLGDVLPASDTIARIGGDEFAVLLKNMDAEAAIQAADKIKKRLEEPFHLEGIPIALSASIGMSLFPGHGEDADTLIRRADIAMHAARKTESGYAIYSSSLDQYSPDRLALMGELCHAIDSNQLFLVYQPKVDLKTKRTVGIEALVRWQHPKLGIILPDQFIELAEKTGLIKQLTFWVIEEVLRQSKNWHNIGLEVSVAVNLSVKSLQAPQPLDQIKGLLSTWGIAPSRLRLEITESLIMADPERAMEIIDHLTKIGIRFSIDDFGTGYSSLNYLKKLPVDEIKIDKSFVMNMMTNESDSLIVHSIIELGHNLGIKITAEGVENRETLERLTLLGCDFAQGYFISKPISQAELAVWLSRKGKK